MLSTRFTAIAAFGLLVSGLVNLAYGQSATHRVRMYFNLGTVDIDLYGNESPLHVEHFLKFVASGDFDNTYIHRSRSGSSLFVQGGEYYEPGPGEFLNENTVLGRGTVVNEFDPTNGLSNIPGSLSAARTSDPDSADNGWFINSTNNAAGFDPGPYTVYGQVTSGLEVIQHITSLPYASSLQGTILETMPVYDNWLVILEEVVELSLLESDFDIDGQVGGSDLSLWEENYGEWNSNLADLNNDARVDQADLDIWESGYGFYDGVSTFAHFEQGDADQDWDVDGLDFLKWQRTVGNTQSAVADGDGDRAVTGLDFLRLQRNHGTSIAPTGASSITVVPEPSSLLLFTLAALILGKSCR